MWTWKGTGHFFFQNQFKYYYDCKWVNDEWLCVFSDVCVPRWMEHWKNDKKVWSFFKIIWPITSGHYWTLNIPDIGSTHMNDFFISRAAHIFQILLDYETVFFHGYINFVRGREKKSPEAQEHIINTHTLTYKHNGKTFYTRILAKFETMSEKVEEEIKNINPIRAFLFFHQS